MDKNIPNKVMREIISGILAERGNSIINNYYRLESERSAIDEETAEKIGVDAVLNNKLASSVLQGEFPIKEVIDLVLTPEEVKLARTRCDKWLDNDRDGEIIV